MCVIISIIIEDDGLLRAIGAAELPARTLCFFFVVLFLRTRLALACFRVRVASLQSGWPSVMGYKLTVPTRKVMIVVVVVVVIIIIIVPRRMVISRAEALGPLAHRRARCVCKWW